MIVRLFIVFIVVLAAFLASQLYTTFSGRAHISNIAAEHMIGPESADLTVVEFLDYSCIYCQQVHPTIMQAVEQDGNVKYAPMPIKSGNADGTSAAYILYAAAKSGKFEQAHTYLMENGTNLSKERIPEIASDLGIDAAVFEENLMSKEIFDSVTDNHSAHTHLKNFVTPTFFIGPNIRYIPENNMPTVEDFLRMFDEARNS